MILAAFLVAELMKAFGRLRSSLLTISLFFAIGLIGYRLELLLPTRAPKLDNTYTLQTKPTPQEVGSYDVLGVTVSKADTAQLLQTADGKTQLAPENGAIEITDDLIHLGRDSFYRETFGNEYFSPMLWVC